MTRDREISRLVMAFTYTLGCAWLLTAVSACTPTPQPLPPDTATETAFTLTSGGEGRDRGINLLQTRDGGYALVGYTSSFGAGQEDVYVVRLDSQGEVLWSQTYGGTGKDNGWAIWETDDNGFLVFGFTNSFGAGGMDMYLVETDSEGNLLWERTFGGRDDEYGWAMVPTPDGGYALAGQTESFGEGDRDGYLVKVSADGKEVWSQTFGGPREDRLYSIDQGADNGFVLVGTTTSFGAGNRDAYLVKTDDSGKLAWTQVFGENQDDVGHSVRQTTDGGYVVTGYTESFGAQDYDTWLIKTDGKGTLQWQELYGQERDDRTIYGEQIDDGGYILVGYTRSFDAAGWDVFLVRTDWSGNVAWHRTFGGHTDDTGYTVRQTSDNGFALTGETYSFGEGGGDMVLIKVNQNGEIPE